MAKAPEHIKIARKEGAKAGLEHLHSYLARNTNDGTNGLATNIAMLEDIRKAGGFRKRGRNAGTFKNEDKAVAWYCNHFASKFGTDKLPPVKGAGGTRRQARRTTPTAEPTMPDTTPEVDPTDVGAIVAAAVAAALGAMGTADVDESDVADVNDEGDENGDEDDDTNGEATPRRATRRTTTPETYPGPRDPDADATNGKLWTLNTEGPEFGYFLCVIDEDGNIIAGGDESLKNGECHELIAEIRSA